jgi:hypothetical protein
MDERFKRPDVYFEDEGRRLFPNGTILHTNGTEETGLVFWGAMDPWYEDCQLIQSSQKFMLLSFYGSASVSADGGGGERIGCSM